MNKQQFIEFAHEALHPEALECVYEQCAECASEIAMFGDSGPGSLSRLRQTILDINRIERTLARLEKREPRDFRFRLPTPR